VVLSDNHADAIVRDADTVIITATFTEANGINETSAPTITIVNGGVTAAAMTKSSNLVWTYSWNVPVGSAAATVSISATDVAGNANSAATGKTAYTIDNTAPTVSIGAPSASTTKAGPITYTITYGGADSVTLVAGNVTLNKTSTANGTVAVSGTGNTTRTVTISSIIGTGTLGISIAAGTASDTAGNTALAAGPSTTFTVDNTAPTISLVTVTPTMVAAGDQVHVEVSATDNILVTSVTADGTALTNTGGATWSGNITAISARGTHAVSVVAKDALLNSTTNTSGSYKVLQVVGASCREATFGITSNACTNFLFALWGNVTIIDTNSFLIDDGGAMGSPVKVVAPGYTGISNGDLVIARGILDVGTTPLPTLTSAPAFLKKY
jgi:hypothetical protein